MSKVMVNEEEDTIYFVEDNGDYTGYNLALERERGLSTQEWLERAQQNLERNPIIFKASASEMRANEKMFKDAVEVTEGKF